MGEPFFFFFWIYSTTVLIPETRHTLVGWPPTSSAAPIRLKAKPTRSTSENEAVDSCFTAGSCNIYHIITTLCTTIVKSDCLVKFPPFQLFVLKYP
jgi:hypothetical protein